MCLHKQLQALQLYFTVFPVLIAVVCLSVPSAFQAWRNVWSWLGCYVCPRCEVVNLTCRGWAARAASGAGESQERPFPAVDIWDRGRSHTVCSAHTGSSECLQARICSLAFPGTGMGKLPFRIKVLDLHSVPGRGSRGQVKQVIILFSLAVWWKPSLSVHCHTFPFSVTILSSLSQIKAPGLKVCCQECLKITVVSLFFFNNEF